MVRPELPTAAAGSSQAPTAAVDNSAPRLTTPESTYKSRNSVQTTGATSELIIGVDPKRSIKQGQSVEDMLQVRVPVGDDVADHIARSRVRPRHDGRAFGRVADAFEVAYATAVITGESDLVTVARVIIDLRVQGHIHGVEAAEQIGVCVHARVAGQGTRLRENVSCWLPPEPKTRRRQGSDWLFVRNRQLVGVAPIESDAPLEPRRQGHVSVAAADSISIARRCSAGSPAATHWPPPAALLPDQLVTTPPAPSIIAMSGAIS